MKRNLCILLAFVLLLSLCACGGKGSGGAKAESAAAVPGIDPKTGAWIGKGGCFTLEPADADEDGTRYHNHIYRVVNDWDGASLMRGREPVYETEGILYGPAATQYGLMLARELREGQTIRMKTLLLDEDGKLLEERDLPLDEGRCPLSFSADDETLYLNCHDALCLYSAAGERLAVIPHAEWDGRLLRGGDGALYYLDETETGGSVCAIDVAAAQLNPLFSFTHGQLTRGDEEAPFLMIRGEGLYRVQSDGSESPLVLWDECGLGVSGVMAVRAQPDGSYLLTGMADPVRLCPAEPSEIKPRAVVRVGVMPGRNGSGNRFAERNGMLLRRVSDFNAQSRDTVVRVVDYSRDGALDYDQALLTLNTELLAGKGPDMLLFRNGTLSPYPYVRKGLLLDLDKAFLQNDPDLSADDLILTPMLRKDFGGLYLLGSSFDIETRVGLRERFGPVWGWDYETYRRIDRETPEGGMVMYNLTREYFLHESAARYLRTAIDWQTGRCDFETAAFVELLTLCRDLRETPEDPSNMVFGSGAQLMEGGYMVTNLSMINSPESFARQQREMGKPLSYLGFPTPDGSSGTDINLGTCLGILRDSRQHEACWRFLKDLLLSEPYDQPVYRPLLEERIRRAQQPGEQRTDLPFGPELSTPMTDGEVRAYWELLSNVEHTTLYDDKAMEIIRDVFAQVLAGDKSPEDAARLIQSRVSLYVNEQA